MSVTLYFAKPADTSIASRSTIFIEALEHTAEAMADIRVVGAPELADIVVIDERYQYRTWHYTDELENCGFVRKHAGRISVINHDDHARVFLPGLYVSLEKSRPPLIPAMPIPYKRDLWKVPVPDQFEFQPERLFTFRGTFHTHPVRKRLCRIMSTNHMGRCEELRKAFHNHDQNDQTSYIKEIIGARFSLCPRGLSPSTYRLYESMQLGRCPVVISDDWVCPAGPDWERFTIFVTESNIRRLPSILEYETESANDRGFVAQEAWNEYFSWPARWNYFLDQVLAIRNQVPEVYGYEILRETWRSLAFRHHYRWTLVDRARQVVARRYRALTKKQLLSVGA